MKRTLPIADIIPIQLRAATCPDWVAELGAIYIDVDSPVQLPPIDVVTDGVHNWCCDGVHRLLAAQQAGRDVLVCNVRTGTEQDAIEAAASANKAHGLRRTNADKRTATAAIIRLHPDWADRQIAQLCGVSHTFVSNVRREKLATVANLSGSDAAVTDDQDDRQDAIHDEDAGDMEDTDGQQDARQEPQDKGRGTEAPCLMGWLGTELDSLARRARETYGHQDDLAAMWSIALRNDADQREWNQ